jgi:ferric-dicitrate binding protein FerR (iron transport regulator)
MSMTVPPSEGETPAPTAGAVLSDESALRTVFFSEYRALAEEARTDLGAASILSQKVVEGAFVRAWDARMKIRTVDELHAFLVNDVHHAAARALSRRAAAQRLGGGETHDASALAVIDPEQAWAHIQDALHGEHSAQALTEAAAISRHDAAHHIASATRGEGWKALVAGTVLAALVITGVLFWLDRRADDNRLTRALAASDTRVISSPPGQVGTIKLDDGSEVRLAPDSRLSIPAAFGDRIRGVGLEGAAVFQVAPGQTRDFLVAARQAFVVAHGTSFAIRAYPGDPGVGVVVTSGKVEVHHAGAAPALDSGGAMYLTDGAAARTASASEREAAAGWASGSLTIDDRPLREVIPQLQRWYGLNIGVPDPADLDRHVTVRASLDSARQVIRGIEKSTGLQFGYAGRDMVFGKPGTVAATR